jgi:hypothetical protein
MLEKVENRADAIYYFTIDSISGACKYFAYSLDEKTCKKLRFSTKREMATHVEASLLFMFMVKGTWQRGGFSGGFA